MSRTLAWVCLSVFALPVFVRADEPQDSGNPPPEARKEAAKLRAEMDQLRAEIEATQAELAQVQAALRMKEAQLAQLKQRQQVLVKQEQLLKLDAEQQREAAKALADYYARVREPQDRWVIGVSVDADAEGPGVVVEGVQPDSPAQKAGLQKNDRIVSVNGIRIADLRDFLQLLKVVKDQKVTLGVERPGAAQPVQVSLSPRKEERAEPTPGLPGLPPSREYRHYPLVGPSVLEKYGDGYRLVPLDTEKQTEDRLRALEERLRRLEEQSRHKKPDPPGERN
ncbi:MAG TPA: PDZ domain-containing protein [Gemmataceae bacterium]